MRIDGHIHFSHYSRLSELSEYLQQLSLDAVGIVSLPDPARTNYNPEAFGAKAALPESCYVFGGLDYGRELAPQVAELHALGADGIKLWDGKPSYQAHTGLAVDAPELLAVYREAGRLGLPVVQHVADPPVFWQGATGGMNREVGIDYSLPEIPDFEELIGQAEHAVSSVPECNFILPHLLFLAGDLERLDALLDRYANAVVDLAPGLYYFGDLSARRDDARAFFEKHTGRIIFGTDAFWFPETQTGLPQGGLERNLAGARRLMTFLETTEEMENPFEPGRERQPRVAGLGLAGGRAGGASGAGPTGGGSGGHGAAAASEAQPVLDAVYGDAFTALLGAKPRPIDRERLGAYLADFEAALRERRGWISETALEADLADVNAVRVALGEARG
ncbi:MAG: amidohydrolase family protein [Spirochaetia bacterium]